MFGAQIDRADGWFTGCPARFGHFDAMIDAVADDVYQRIVQLFDDGLVQFGFGAEGFHLDLFAEFLREIAHQAFEFAEGAADRQHADIEGGIAQFVGQSFDLFGYGDEGCIAAGQRYLGQVRLHRDHFADQIDQLIKSFSRNADAGGGFLLAELRYAPCGRF